MYVKTHLCTSVYKWLCTATLVLKRHALLDAGLFCRSALAVIVQLLEWSKHKSSRSNLNKDNCLFSDANCCAEIKDYRLMLAGLSVGDFLHIMTEIGPVYCEIWCQNCFVRTKYHFDSNVRFFFAFLQSRTLCRLSIMETSSISSFGKLPWSTTQWER